MDSMEAAGKRSATGGEGEEGEGAAGSDQDEQDGLKPPNID